MGTLQFCVSAVEPNIRTEFFFTYSFFFNYDNYIVMR